MTSADKKQELQSVAEEGKQLINKAELLLQNVVLRNARLSQEIKQTRLELEEKLTQQQP